MKWTSMQEDLPEMADIIQRGIDKLGSYQERVERVPAYVLAMRKFPFSIALRSLTFSVINPAIKLRWFAECRPERIEWAKQLFINTVRLFLLPR